MTRPQSSSRNARGRGRESCHTPRATKERLWNKRSGYEISCERRLGTSQAKNPLNVLSHCCLHSFSFSFFFLSEFRLRWGCIRATGLGFDSGFPRVDGGLASLLFCVFLLNVGSINSAMLQSVPFLKLPLFCNSVTKWFEGEELATVVRLSTSLWCLECRGMSSPSS